MLFSIMKTMAKRGTGACNNIENYVSRKEIENILFINHSSSDTSYYIGLANYLSNLKCIQ